MPAKPPAANCIEIALHGILGTDTNVVNVYHVALAAAGPYDNAELSAWAQELYTDFAGDVLVGTHISADYTLIKATARDISVPNGGDGLYEPSSGAPGHGGSSAPANVACCVSWHEFISYRGGHPRTYLAGIPQSIIASPQLLSPAGASGLQTDMNAFLSSVNAGVPPGATNSGQLVVVHYSLNKVVQTPPLVRPILSATVNTRLDSQRRRLGKQIG